MADVEKAKARAKKKRSKKAGKKKQTTTLESRTVKVLRKEGYIAENSTKRIPRSYITKDLFGFLDVVAIAGHHSGVHGVQCTSKGHMRDRLNKIRKMEAAKVWLMAGNPLEVWGWWKKDNGRYAYNIWKLAEKRGEIVVAKRAEQ